jgi:membrane fusion protein, multidrug efflux system
MVDLPLEGGMTNKIYENPTAASEGLLFDGMPISTRDLSTGCKDMNKLVPRSAVRGCLFVTALLLTGNFVLAPIALSADTTEKLKPAPVATPAEWAVTLPRHMSDHLVGLGHVQAYNTVVVRSQVEGQIVRLNFEEGQVVHKGDLLAQIDPRPFEAKLQIAVAHRDRDRAQLASTTENLHRDLRLFSRGYVSQDLVDNERAQVVEATAAVQSDLANVEDAELQLSYTNLTAPIDGITGIRKIDAGNIIHPTDPDGLVVITQMQPISVIFTLPETDLPQIQRQMAKGTTTVLTRSEYDRSAVIQGTLELIDNQIIESSGSLRLKAIFPNPSNRLWPGELVNVQVPIDHRPGALTVALPVAEQASRPSFRFARPSKLQEVSHHG